MARVTRELASICLLVSILSRSGDNVLHSPRRHPGGQEGLSDSELTLDPETSDGGCWLHEARHARHPDHLHLGLARHLVTCRDLGTCTSDCITANTRENRHSTSTGVIHNNRLNVMTSRVC